ncbi:MAG TPA: hypothetical protein VFE62_02075, partial [Gemmataceae bacterium]|nr:hypothetical protein [Gemmataceae bacterium]
DTSRSGRVSIFQEPVFYLKASASDSSIAFVGATVLAILAGDRDGASSSFSPSVRFGASDAWGTSNGVVRPQYFYGKYETVFPKV